MQFMGRIYLSEKELENICTQKYYFQMNCSLLKESLSLAPVKYKRLLGGILKRNLKGKTILVVLEDLFIVNYFVCYVQGCASSPNDSEQQRRLRGAAEELRAATNNAASDALKKKLMRRLEVRLLQTEFRSTPTYNDCSYLLLCFMRNM